MMPASINDNHGGPYGNAAQKQEKPFPALLAETYQDATGERTEQGGILSTAEPLLPCPYLLAEEAGQTFSFSHSLGAGSC